MSPRSQPESGGAHRASSMPTAGSSEASQADSLAEESVVKVCKQCMMSSSGDEVVCPSCGSPLVPIRSVRESYVGETIDGKYRLVRKIGSGGMGTVYLGVNDDRDERVAVKFLAKKYAANEQIIMRFLNEARSYGRVTHPNAVTLKEYGQHKDGALYLITEFVDGEPLSRAVQGAGPLTPGAAISVAGQVCGVLSAAHREGVIHRDLKPDNIMLVEDDNGQYHAKVLDFGIAKIVDDERGTLTQTGAVFGTPEFMSPEQARGDVADERADIYALGLILFYASTGVRPFESQNQYKLLDMQQHQPPPRPSDINESIDVPAPLERVILTCLEKDPDDRYDSAIDLRVELERVAERLNTGPVTVDEKSLDGDDSTDLDEGLPRGVDSEDEDTLFLRPFELARRAGVDSTGADTSDLGGGEVPGRDVSEEPEAGQLGARDSATYPEPGMSGEFDLSDSEPGARREPGGSLSDDLRVADPDSDQTPHPVDTSIPSMKPAGRGFVGKLRDGAADVGDRLRGAFDRVAGGDEAKESGKWAVNLDTPDWSDAFDSTERGARRAASSVSDAWSFGKRLFEEGYLPIALAGLVVCAGTLWGWSQLQESDASGGDAGVVVQEQSETTSGDQSTAAIRTAATQIQAGELERAESTLKQLAGGDELQKKVSEQRRALLRKIGRLRRLESSLKRSLEDKACGRARRTLRAIGESSSGLKAALAADVDNCEAMVPTPESAENDDTSEPSASESASDGVSDEAATQPTPEPDRGASQPTANETEESESAEAASETAEASGSGGRAATADKSERSEGEAEAEPEPGANSTNEAATATGRGQKDDEQAGARPGGDSAPQHDTTEPSGDKKQQKADEQQKDVANGESDNKPSETADDGAEKQPSGDTDSDVAESSGDDETNAAGSGSGTDTAEEKSDDTKDGDKEESLSLPPKQM